MTLQGRVQNGVVVFQNGASLPDGTVVQVAPLSTEAGKPLVIAAMDAEPHFSPEDVAELQRVIAAGKRPAAAIDPFAPDSAGPA